VGAAWIGLLGTAVGAVAGGLVAVVLQRRKEATEVRVRREQRQDAALILVAEVRATAQEWITYLQYVVFDASEERFPDLVDFDHKSSELRHQTHQAMARTSHLGKEDVFYSRFAESLRSLEGEVRQMVAMRSSENADQILGRTDSFGSLFSQRQVVTTRLINDVINGRWIIGPGGQH
jgi:hypothetical protein